MMPDYQNYSLEELYSVTECIDRDIYPQRYEQVVMLINERESSESMSEEDQIYVEVKKGFDSKLGCESLILSGLFGGIFVTISSVIIGFTAQNSEYRIDTIISVVLYAFLSIFLYFKSRFAATLLFAIYFLTHLKIWFFDMQPRGLVAGVLLSVVFFAAMLATYYWHNNYQNEDEE